MADQIYYSLFTEQGLELLTEAIQNGTKLGITSMAFGDGAGELPIPDASFRGLVNEVYRTQLNSLAPDPNNKNWLRAEAIIASAVGGFNIRELGLYAGDTLVAYSNYPATYKPNPADGTARIMTFRMILQIDNTANFELKIDADIVMATIRTVEEAKVEAKSYADSTKIQYVESVADLLLVDPLIISTVQTISYHHGLNKGGWLYKYDDSQKEINNGGTILNGWVAQDLGYITPELFGAYADLNHDDISPIRNAIQATSKEIFLDFGANKYLVSDKISLKNNLIIRSNSAYFTVTDNIGSDLNPTGIFDAENLSGVNIIGEIQTYIDHKLFKKFSEQEQKYPTVIAFRANQCIDSNFGKFRSKNAANYYYSQNFKEYGVVDVRNSTDCEIGVDIDCLYKNETVTEAPSTCGVFGTGNTRCDLYGSVKNTYWSGILWEGTDCKVINPIVRNTKGSNLNIAGINTNALNVDLKDSEQGNVSIGEGADVCYSCNILGGEIRGARFSNVALHNSSKNCKIDANVSGWGQGATTTDISTVGVRVRGFDNVININAFKERDGYISNGNALNVVTDSLVNPNTSGTHVKAVIYGAQVDIRAPKTTVDVVVNDVPDKAGVQMGFRCAGSHVKSVVGNNCLRAFAYVPVIGDTTDSEDVRIGNIVSNKCKNEPIAPLLTSRQSTRVKDMIYASDSSYGLNDVLYALDVITKDSSLNPAKEQLAAAIRVISSDAFGTSYGLDFLASTISEGNLTSVLHKLRHNSLEIGAISGGGSQLICYGPDNKKYVLQPPINGGAAIWVLKDPQ